MTVSLINTSGRLKSFALPHETYCKARGRCACRLTRELERRIPSSITIAADTRVSDLDDAVLQVPDIAQALRNGEIRVERKPANKNKIRGDS
jgi:hypothetical protein